MANKWVEALEDLGRRAKEWIADLGTVLQPEPELAPVPVRPRRHPGRNDGDRHR